MRPYRQVSILIGATPHLNLAQADLYFLVIYNRYILLRGIFLLKFAIRSQLINYPHPSDLLLHDQTLAFHGISHYIILSKHK